MGFTLTANASVSRNHDVSAATNRLTFGPKVELLSCVQTHFELHIGVEGQLGRRSGLRLEGDQAEASVWIQDVRIQTDSGLTIIIIIQGMFGENVVQSRPNRDTQP